MLSLPIFFAAVFTSSFALDKTNKVNNTNTKERSGRWANDDEPKVSVQLGYYLPSDTGTYTFNNDESNESSDDNANNAKQYTVPTSFDEFKPDSKQSKKNSYKYSSGGPKNIPPNWKGYSGDYDFPPWAPSAWSSSTWSPSDMAAMIHAFQDMQEKPTGLLDKLASKPLLAVAALIPLAILLAAVLPSLFNFLMLGAMGMGTPTVTTTATGGKVSRKDELSVMATVMRAIQKYNSGYSTEFACLQRAICEAIKNENESEFKSIQRSVYKAFTFIDDYWLTKLGMKELIDSVGSGSCEKINCSKDNSLIKQ